MAKMKVNLGHLKRNNIKKKETPLVVKKEVVTQKKEISNIDREVILTHFSIDYEITKEKDVNDYLLSKTRELMGIHMSARLELGKIFTDVHKKLANSKSGVYIKWLEANGFNRMTATRHKNRYELFAALKNEKAKTFIAATSQKNIDSIFGESDRNEIMSQLENITESTDGNELISNKLLEEKIKPIIEFNVNKEVNRFQKLLKTFDVEKLDDKKQMEFKKLIDKLEKLIS